MSAYFISFEIVVYVLLGICLIHAWKHGIANVLRLIAGILFGLALELATIRQLHAYSYGQFPTMVLDVPLCIGVAWGCFAYSAMEFSNASSLPYLMRPIMDALFCLTIDLSLDAVAIRLGFWDWGRGLDFQYFGVPYANFWAWFWVIFFFSFGYRLFARRGDWVAVWIAPIAALIIGLSGVLGTNMLISRMIPRSVHIFVVGSVVLLALILVAMQRPRFYLRPVPALTLLVPMCIHIFILIAGLLSGILLNLPFLLFVSIAMMIVSFFLHRRTIEELLGKGSASPSPTL